MKKKIKNKNIKKKNNYNLFKNNKIKKINNYNLLKIKKKINKKKTNKEEINKKIIINKNIYIPKYISISDIAKKTFLSPSEIIKKLFLTGKIITKNELLDQKTAITLIKNLGFKTHKLKENIKNNINFKKKKKLRAPIITIMGHVDHGKTSLLDYIRKTKITNSEIGGITQHIGAYHIKFNKKIITFIDTPGHEAFASMRAKGAKITDIIVLLVAADDGVMPQTREIISHALSGKIPLIIAISKIDKIDINLKKIYKELINENIIPEKLGGNFPFVKISIKTGEGIDSLLEYILILAEIMELKTSISAPAKGIIISSKLDKGKGPIATILTKSGILKIGDFIITDTTYGKIKFILNENLKKINKIKPSIPGEIYGLIKLPKIGEKFYTIKNEKKIKEILLYKEQKQEIKKNFLLNKKKKNIKNISLILKTNLQSYKEILVQNILKLSTKNININIMYVDIGEISENDVNLAISSNSIIIGFNTKINLTAKNIAKKNNIYIKNFNIIYEIINEIKNKILNKNLNYKNKKIGLIEIKQIFNKNKNNFIIGCYVKKGKIRKDSIIKIKKNNKTICIGKIESLKRFKKNVEEVKTNLECGISFKNFKNIEIIKNIKINDTLIVLEKL